jgi:siroheme decarboxylase
MIEELDKKIIQLIQGDLPLDEKPFAILAESLGISEEEFLHRVRSLKEEGIIRRFGATLYHQEAGYSSNAMVAWRIPEERIPEVGEAMSRYREVTHCYQRETHMDWTYNLYTMIHGDDREQCAEIAAMLSKETGMKDYLLLFSEREFKKTSMAYF